MKHVASMTAEEQIAALDLDRDWQPHGAPEDWDEWHMTSEDTEGITRDWRCFCISGYVPAVNDQMEMCAIPPGAPGFLSRRWHFIITPEYSSHRARDFVFTRGDLGGVECYLPDGLIARMHVRQIHLAGEGDGTQEPAIWQQIKEVAGKRVKIEICGSLIYEERHPAISEEAWSAGRFISFHRADRRCPTVTLDVDGFQILETAVAPRGFFSRLFTRAAGIAFPCRHGGRGV